MVATTELTSGKPTRHQRGVQKLNPELVQKIRDELAKEPISKSALARRLGVSRPTIIWYLKALASQPEPAPPGQCEPVPSIQMQAQATQDDVVKRATRACDEIEEQIRELRASPPSTSVACAAFKGYSVLERFLKLLAELRQEISPPQQNLFVQVAALMSQPVDPRTLAPAERRTILGIETTDAAPT